MSATTAPQPTIRTFNTGRSYTARGQRIAYAEISRDDEFVSIAQVVFYDMDRHVDGQVKVAVLAGEAVNEKPLLDAYDHSNYGNPEEDFLILATGLHPLSFPMRQMTFADAEYAEKSPLLANGCLSRGAAIG